MTHSSNPTSRNEPGAQSASSLARLAPQVAALFPSGTVAAELLGAGDPAFLSAQEMQLTPRFAPKRIREFAAGRLCARLALGELGIQGWSMLPAEDRQPVWPPAIAGSITHTDGYCTAVVARSRDVASLGVDSEVAQAVRQELWPRICVAAELAWLEHRPPEQRTACAALIFAAKEAFYKCQYPVTREWLDFTAVRIEVPDPTGPGGEILVWPQRRVQLEASARFPLRGRFRFHEGWVTAGIALPRLLPSA
jgi:4'-phosphopantetheinyl transferase EntD